MPSSSGNSGEVYCTTDVSLMSTLAMHGVDTPVIHNVTDQDNGDGLRLLNHCQLTDEQMFRDKFSSDIQDSLTILNKNLRSANSNFASLSCFFITAENHN